MKRWTYGVLFLFFLLVINGLMPDVTVLGAVWLSGIVLIALFQGTKRQLAKPRRVKEKKYRPGRVRYESPEARLKKRIRRIRRSLMAEDMKEEMERRARDQYEREIEGGQ